MTHSIFAAMLLALSAGNLAHAADIVLLPGDPERVSQVSPGAAIPPEDLPTIWIRGEIKAADVRKVHQVIAEAKTLWTDLSYVAVNLDSPGGDVQSAMAIAESIRRARLETAVRPGSSCASACVLILAGGVIRSIYAGGQVYLHRPYFADAKAATSQGYRAFEREYNSVLARHREFFVRMGISPELVDEMSRIPSKELRSVFDIDPQLAKRTNLIGQDPAYLEWVRARRSAELGPACLAWEDKVWACFWQTRDYTRCADSTKPPAGAVCK